MYILKQIGIDWAVAYLTLALRKGRRIWGYPEPDYEGTIRKKARG
jgi:hypothetical protein